MGSNIIVEDGRFQTGYMVYRHDGLFRGVHATDRGAILPPHESISGTHTLDPGVLPRFPPIRRATYMPLIRARGREDSLKLHPGDHIREAFVTVFPLQPRIEGFVSRGEDDGAHPDLQLLLRHPVIDGMGTADSHTLQALGTEAAIETPLGLGNCLLRGDGHGDLFEGAASG